MIDTTTAVTALHTALTAGQHGDDLRELFTPDATTTEHPSALNPRGRTSTLAEMLAASRTTAMRRSRGRRTGLDTRLRRYSTG
jgi:hypothetical protein